jgi:hypothetical protein
MTANHTTATGETFLPRGGEISAEIGFSTLPEKRFFPGRTRVPPQQHLTDVKRKPPPIQI